ncbi:MAG: TonB-dependent receptor [Bacteroidota bacterium]
MRCAFFVCLLLAIALSTFSSYAQVSGTIYDAQTRLPLVGVSVSSADSSNSTTTNEKGYFELAKASASTALTCSFVGYQTQISLANEQSVQIYLEPVNVSLNEVVVTGYENNRKLLETAGSVALLNTRELNRFSNTSLVPAMNTLPGIRMEERSPGSYRISIRGSTLRSPFGVRNVKIYWNDIPFTDPSGSTALNLIDFSTVGKVEIIKGPGGSLYGAGTGGVILLQSPAATYGEQSAEVATLAGSFGLRGIRATVRTGSAKENIAVTYAKQQSNGYRDHSALNREIVNIRAQFYTSPKRTISFNGFYNQLYYEIPGGLTLQEFQKNPRLSRPRAIEQNSSIQQKTLNLGLAQTYQLNEQLANTTTFYATFTQFENPFLTDYKRNTEQGLGGRTKFVYAKALGSVKSRFTLGGEFQHNFTAFRNYNNKGGKLDTLRYDDEITALQGFVFAQAEFDFARNYFLTIGGSYNHLRYQIARLSDAATNPNYAQNRRFAPVLSPRIALLKKIGANIALHSSVSFGFSPPAVDDIRTSDGGINTGLEAEKGVNYEMGARGTALRKQLDFEMTVFFLQMTNTITTYTNPQGVALFRNAGNTDQNGVETRVGYQLVDAPASTISRARVFASYTFNNFHFRKYESNGKDLSGNYLTGSPQHNLSGGLDVETSLGFYTNITINYVGKTPLNDANTVYADAYTLLGGRLGYRKTMGSHWSLSVFGGVDNALNQTYSLGNDLNAFGGRYYQPSASINYYAGLSVAWKK